MSAKSFLVFGSYVEGANWLNDKDRLSFYDGLTAYASLGIEVEMRPNARALFLGVKPTVDKNLEIHGNAVNAGIASGEMRRKKRDEKLRLESESEQKRTLEVSDVNDAIVSEKKGKKVSKKGKEAGKKNQEDGEKNQEDGEKNQEDGEKNQEDGEKNQEDGENMKQEIPRNIDQVSHIKELKSGILVETRLEKSDNCHRDFGFTNSDILLNISQTSDACLTGVNSTSVHSENILAKGLSENSVSFCSNSVPNGVGSGNGNGIGNGKEAAAAADVCSDVLREFLEFCPRFDQVLMLTNKQKNLINQRLVDYGRENVTKMLKKAGGSDFLCGLVNANFKADFSWIFHEDHFESILNGKYDQVWARKKKPRVGMDVHDVRENPFRKGDV